ncbi:MAG: LacI family DNA-binding transcriptional regulator [Spirochaetaceae bacterium]
MVTMHDIAEKAGVSTTTVSRVLNTKNSSIPISNETKKRVQKIAQEMGYSPNMYAKTLRTKKSMLIGLVVWDLTDFFFSDILRGIENTLHSSGYNILLNSAEADTERERVCLEKMRDLHVDGILLVGGTAETSTFNLETLGIKRSSVVLIGTAVEEEEINAVTVDNYTGGYIGMEYLLGMNRKQYVYLAGKRKTTDMEKRLMGVKQAAHDHLALENFEVRHTGPGEREGYDAAMELLPTLTLPAAVFAVSDLTAFGVIRAVKDRNLRVPEDIAVLGFDDISMSTFFLPRLSTIRQPRYNMGEMGAGILLDSIGRNEAATAKRILLSPELVTRESS